MRTLSGTSFLIADMAMLEHTSTPAVASPIDIPFMADPVVPSVGHIPNNSTKVGFSTTRPLYIMRSLFIFVFFISDKCIIGTSCTFKESA